MVTMTTIPRSIMSEHMHPGHANETNCTIPHDHRASNIEWLDQALAALCFTTAAASVALNMYVLYVLLKQWRNRTIFLFFNMAITDMMSGICAIHLGHIIIFYGYIEINPLLCSIQAFMFNVISLMTPQLMSYICIMRFMGVSYPTLYNSPITKKSMMVVAGVSWVYTCLLILLQMVASKGVEISLDTTRFCDIILTGESFLHELMYYSSLIINVLGFLVIATLSTVLTVKLMHKAAETKARSARNKKISRMSVDEDRKISLMMAGKIKKASNYHHRNTYNVIERKLKMATRLSLMFALNFMTCYVLDVLYYALPAIHFENIRMAIEWMTGCDATLSLYLRFWYYYSVALSSLVNSLIHLAVNDIVKDHIRVVKRFLKAKCCKLRSFKFNFSMESKSSDETANERRDETTMETQDPYEMVPIMDTNNNCSSIL